MHQAALWLTDCWFFLCILYYIINGFELSVFGSIKYHKLLPPSNGDDCGVILVCNRAQFFFRRNAQGVCIKVHSKLEVP